MSTAFTSTTSAVDTIRYDVACALDAPAPSIIVDGTALRPTATREQVLEWLLPVRRLAIATNRSLGAKSGVLMLDEDGRSLRFEFCQGISGGGVDTNPRVCVNSATAAVTVATELWGWSSVSRTFVVRMGDEAFEVERS